MDQYYISKQHVHTWSYMRILTQHVLAYSSDHKLSMPCWHSIGECAILPTWTNASDRSPRAFFDTGLQGREPWPQMTVQYSHVWSSVLCMFCMERVLNRIALPVCVITFGFINADWCARWTEWKHMKPFHVFSVCWLRTPIRIFARTIDRRLLPCQSPKQPLSNSKHDLKLSSKIQPAWMDHAN